MLNKYTVTLYKYTTDTIKVKEVKARLLKDGRYKLKGGKKVVVDEIAKKEPHTCYKLQNIEWHDYIIGAEEELGKLEKIAKDVGLASDRAIKETSNKLLTKDVAKTTEPSHSNKSDKEDDFDDIQVMIGGRKLSKKEIIELGFVPTSIVDKQSNCRVYANETINNLVNDTLEKIEVIKEDTEHLQDTMDWEPKKFDGAGVHLSGSGIRDIAVDSLNNSTIDGSGINEIRCEANFGNVKIGGSGITTICAGKHVIEYRGHWLSIDGDTVNYHIPSGSNLSFINGKLFLNHELVYDVNKEK